MSVIVILLVCLINEHHDAASMMTHARMINRLHVLTLGASMGTINERHGVIIVMNDY